MIPMGNRKITTPPPALSLIVAVLILPITDIPEIVKPLMKEEGINLLVRMIDDADLVAMTPAYAAPLFDAVFKGVFLFEVVC